MRSHNTTDESTSKDFDIVMETFLKCLIHFWVCITPWTILFSPGWLRNIISWSRMLLNWFIAFASTSILECPQSELHHMLGSKRSNDGGTNIPWGVKWFKIHIFEALSISKRVAEVNSFTLKLHSMYLNTSWRHWIQIELSSRRFGDSLQ